MQVLDAYVHEDEDQDSQQISDSEALKGSALLEVASPEKEDSTPKVIKDVTSSE